MTIIEITAHLTPAEQGVVQAVIDAADDISDDMAVDAIYSDLSFSDQLDMTRSAAEAMAYAIVHDAKRV